MDFQVTNNRNTKETLLEEIAGELQATKSAINEITTTLNQSQSEVNRITQKKAISTAQIQKIQADLERVPRQAIQEAYNEAMETQQRFLVIRGQIEKLQEQLTSLQKLRSYLERINDVLGAATPFSGAMSDKSLGTTTLEMLINAQEAERQRLSRQMHDGPAQALSNFIVQAEIATKLFETDPDKAKDELDRLKNSAMNTFQKVRSFISELRPMMLDDLGLLPTLKRHISNTKESTGTDVSLIVNGGEKKIEPYLEVFIFRTIQELVSNAIKHNLDNASKLKIEVVLTLDSNQAIAMVKDNGKGFDPAEIKASSGLGLKVAQERAEMLDGSLTIDSGAETGTTITLTIPVVDVTA